MQTTTCKRAACGLAVPPYQRAKPIYLPKQTLLKVYIYPAGVVIHLASLLAGATTPPEEPLDLASLLAAGATTLSEEPLDLASLLAAAVATLSEEPLDLASLSAGWCHNAV